MAEIARFFDAVAYSESDQAEIQSKFRSTGVIGGITNTLGITAPGGMFVGVTEGEAMVEGFWYKNTPPTLQLPIATNTSGSTRVDIVALRLDRVANTLSAVVKQGTPGAGAPTLTQIVGGVWELGLATVTVPTGTTSAVTAGMLADIRTYSRTVRSQQDVADNTIGYNNVIDGAITNLLLNYKVVTDIFNGTAVPVTTYTNLVAAQNFTVSASARFLLICLQMASYATAAAAFEAGIHVLIDGATRYLVGGDSNGGTGGSVSSSGTILIPAPAAGVHNITPQIYATTALSALYVRPASLPGVEALAMQIMEIRK